MLWTKKAGIMKVPLNDYTDDSALFDVQLDPMRPGRTLNLQSNLNLDLSFGSRNLDKGD